ncbi:MAG TPA: wax ester/triacylglycerol synthase domain-containing protein [Acidimicrobiia bacterium]|nr:wax ester/triacylglycerol synthase domain-containing protein [Acidimicrobiia bacterium]
MSDAEGIMWAVEKDPALRSDFCNLTVLDRSPSRARMHEAARAAIAAIPRLGQRVVAAPLRLVPPAWVDDPALDLDYHVRFVGVPHPGGTRELLDLCASLAEAPFDRSRPLWEFTVIHGLVDGRAAMLQKVHHTITDGVGGLRLSLALVDLERDPRPDASTVAVLRRELAEVVADVPRDPIARTSPLDVTRDAVVDAAGRSVAVARRAAAEALETLRTPTSIPTRASEAAALAASLRRQLLVTEGARSDVLRARSLRRHFAIAAASLPEAKEAATRLGGTINDVFVTALTGGLGAYHRAHGGHATDLRLAMPVSTRTRGDADANQFTPARVVVPMGPDDPVARFDVVRERLAAARGEVALHAAQGLASIAALLPTAMLVPIVRNQARTIDFAASNLRGSPVPLYLAGARIEASYPFGPRTGCALNVTLLSYCDEVHLGYNIDTAAVVDPDELLAMIETSWHDVVHASRARRRTSSARRRGAGAERRSGT